jgi:hypothetical protein
VLIEINTNLKSIRKKFKVSILTFIISIDKKVDTSKLYDYLLNLDLDEGIRVENPRKTKKIFINRNLLGIYVILVRTCKSNLHEKGEVIYKEIIYNLNEVESVLKIINQNLNNYDVWIY